MDILKLQLMHLFNSQELQRIPEPSSISDGVAQTQDYSKSKDSAMIVPYLLSLHLIDRLCEPSRRSQALELCSGLGNFTQLLATKAGFDAVTGVDMSPRMISIAEQSSDQAGLSDKIRFIKDDVTLLSSVSNVKVDLVTFMNGAHHLDSLQNVKTVLTRACEVTKPGGVIFLMDPVLPKTKDIANQYIKIFGADYVRKGLLYFYKDFRDSVFASWTPEEMKSVIPQGTKRKWIHILPFGFPTFQFVVGLPEGRENLWATKGPLSKEIEHLVPEEYRMEYMALKCSVALGKKTILS